MVSLVGHHFKQIFSFQNAIALRIHINKTVNFPEVAYAAINVFQVNSSRSGILSNSFRASLIRPDLDNSFKTRLESIFD
ncbi:Zinc finger, RING-type [Gossypium australe]|uniref:Zinc finger, RING-type n=1 Tax=Gossypium australe TaxID=47621 RepID=A0A5B6W1W9_9ROSI|nr:Zinc finger, RING-type [Gossypium australe]